MTCRVGKFLYNTAHAAAMHQFRNGDFAPYCILVAAEANVIQLIILVNKMKEAVWR